MNKLYIIIIVSLLSLSAAYGAPPQVLVTERGQILVPSLPDWERGENMFGMPFIFFSPRANDQRSNISFTATGVESDINLPSLGKNQDSYKKIKTEWAASVGGKAEAFIPYKTWKSKQGHTIHEIGVEFTHEEKRYVETSFYIDCRGMLIYSKSLRLKVNQDHQGQFGKLIDEMDCGL